MSLVREALTPRQNAFPMPTPEEIAFDNSPQILAITGTFFTMAAIMVLLRCYVRAHMLKVFGIDDYIMVLGMVSEPAKRIDLHLQSFLIGALRSDICLLQSTHG